MKKGITKGRLINTLYILLIFASLIGIFRLKETSKKNVEKIIEENKSKIVTLEKKDILTDLIDRGLAAKCAFSQDLVGSKMTGTIYIDGGFIRTDITTSNKTEPNKLSHTIIRDDYMYLWYDKNVTGMRLIAKPNNAETIESTPSQSSSQILALQNLVGLLDTSNYKCEEWEADSFKFVLPPEVTFIDAAEFAKELSKQLCQKCDAENTEASRLLCKKELECNKND